MLKTAFDKVLSGQVAVITGAGGGIGAAIATCLSDMGAHAVLCGRTRASLEASAAIINKSGGRKLCDGMRCQRPSLRRGNGAACRTRFRRSFVPLMMRSHGGHIINISSISGKNPLPNGAAYAASKWGLNGLSYSVAEELRAHNIRVSVICPGSTHTEFGSHAGMNAEKMLQAADVAHVVAMIVTQAPQSFASEIVLRPTQKP